MSDGGGWSGAGSHGDVGATLSAAFEGGLEVGHRRFYLSPLNGEGGGGWRGRETWRGVGGGEGWGGGGVLICCLS